MFKMSLVKMLISLFLVVFLTRPCQSNKTLGLYSQSPGQQRKPPGLALNPGWLVTVCGPSDPTQTLGEVKKPGLEPEQFLGNPLWPVEWVDWWNLSGPWKNSEPY